MRIYQMRLQLVTADSDATLLRVLGVVRARQALIHAAAYERADLDTSHLLLDMEPTNCGIDTMSLLLLGVIGVLKLDCGPADLRKSTTPHTCGCSRSPV